MHATHYAAWHTEREQDDKPRCQLPSLAKHVDKREVLQPGTVSCATYLKGSSLLQPELPSSLSSSLLERACRGPKLLLWLRQVWDTVPSTLHEHLGLIPGKYRIDGSTELLVSCAGKQVQYLLISMVISGIWLENIGNYPKVAPDAFDTATGKRTNQEERVGPDATCWQDGSLEVATICTNTSTTSFRHRAALLGKCRVLLQAQTWP